MRTDTASAQEYTDRSVHTPCKGPPSPSAACALRLDSLGQDAYPYPYPRPYPYADPCAYP